MKLYYDSETNKVYGQRKGIFYEHTGRGEWEQTILPKSQYLELQGDDLPALRDSLLNETDPTGLNANQPGAKLDAGKPRMELLQDFGLALDHAERYGERDDDSGLRHAEQVAWNALARLELILRKSQGQHDVLPSQGSVPERKKTPTR